MRWDFRVEHGIAASSVQQEEFLPIIKQFLTEAIDDPAWTIWVVDLDGLIIAHIFCQRIKKMPRPENIHPEFGYVTNVYTRPTYRKLKVGSRLLRHVQAWANEEKLEMLVLWPSTKAIPFYEREGFLLSGSMEWIQQD